MGIPSFLRHAFEGGTTSTTENFDKNESTSVKSYDIIEMDAKPNPEIPATISVIVKTDELTNEPKTESTTFDDVAIAKTVTKPAMKKQAKKSAKKQKK